MANKANLATSLVATAPSPATSGTSLTVDSGEGTWFPSASFYATAHPANEIPDKDTAEIVLVTAKTTDTFTITRAQKGTTAKSIAVGWRISNSVYVEDFDEKVTGPASAADQEVVRYGGTTGKLVESSGVKIGDDSSIYDVEYIVVNGDGFGSGGVQVDTIGEKTTAAGVTVDGVLLKDGGLDANTTGSAATLTTPRTINGISFNGSANITVPSDITPSTSGNVLTSDGTVWTSAAPSGGGGLTWSAVTTNATMAVDTGSLANKATLLTLTLPATSAVGKTVRVAGMNAGLWKIAQAASQYIKFGNTTTTTGAGGSLASTLTYDAVELVCIEANVGWTVVSSVGNVSIV